MMRITAKVLDEMVSLPSFNHDDDNQFDPPEDRFLGDHTDPAVIPIGFPNFGSTAETDGIGNVLDTNKWKYKGTIANTNHPLTERPPVTDVDLLMWEEYGDKGKNRFPQEIPNYPDAGSQIQPIIKLIPGHEHDYPCRPAQKLDKIQQTELLTQLSFYLKKGWIKPSSSPYGACILFVPKKNGKFRMCIDYRALNKITIKDKYPLPDAEQVIEQLQGATHFSQLDLSHGYHQCILADEDIEKTTFRTIFGAYDWKVMTFGFSNAVPAFIRFMNNTLYKQLGRCCMVFIDDIVIYSKSKEQHIIDCRDVMESISEANLYVNWTKSQFDVKTIKYLGLNISKEGISPFEDKVAVVKDWERPDSIYHLRSFLGAVGYYRKFIFNFSKIAKPLTDLTKDNPDRKQVIVTNLTVSKWGRNQKTQSINPSEWTEACETAFTTLKEALCSYPVLLLPDPTKPYELMTDASKQACGCVLMQRDSNGKLHPVAFYSSKHNEAEANYPVHEFELLAIFKALKQWRHLLIGSGKITIYTDHKPLTHLLEQDKLSSRQERWITYLADFDVDILAVPGTANQVADCLSRYNYDELNDLAEGIKRQFAMTAQATYMQGLPCKSYASCFCNGFASSYAMHGFEQVSQIQPSSVCQSCKPSYFDAERTAAIFGGGTQFKSMTVESIMKSIVDSYITDPLAQLVITQKTTHIDLKLVESIIIHSDRDGRETLYIPQGAVIANSQLQTEHPVEGDVLRPECSLREELLRDIHSTGHIGIGKMISKVRENYYWPRLSHSVTSFVRGCKLCQQNKQRTHKLYGKLRTLELPTRRWSRINIDFIVAMPMTKKGFDAIMVVVDGYSKRAHFIPTHSTATAINTAYLFYEHVWKLHGLPEKIVSDRDSKFTSKMWQTLFKLFGSQLAMSTAFHPQTDGLVERTNLTLKEMLRSFSDNARLDWDLFLPAAEFVYNSTYNTSIKDTPFKLDTGQQPLDPHGLAVRKILADTAESPDIVNNYDDQAKGFIEQWNESLVKARQYLEESSERMTKQFAKFRDAVKEGTFKLGSKVYLDGTHLKVVDKTGVKGARKALDKRRLGPYEITEVLGNGTAFRLKLPEHQSFHDVQPISRLELVNESSEFPHAHVENAYLPVIIDNVEEFEIEKIIRHRTARGMRYFWVKYLGYDESYNEWKLRSDLSNAPEVLSEYEISNKLVVNTAPRRSQRLKT